MDKVRSDVPFNHRPDEQNSPMESKSGEILLEHVHSIISQLEHVEGRFHSLSQRLVGSETELTQKEKPIPDRRLPNVYEGSFLAELHESLVKVKNISDQLENIVIRLDNVI